MSDLELEIFGISDASGTFTNHPDAEIAGLNSGAGEFVLRIVADSHAVLPQGLCKSFQIEHV